MDNDSKGVKMLKSVYRKIRFKQSYYCLDVKNNKWGNQYIYEAIMRGKPCMVARGGAVELRCIGEYLNGKVFSPKMKEEVQICAGVFPPNDEILTHFSEYYIECMSQADLLALWSVGAEKQIVKQRCTQSKFTHLEALEPYYFNNPCSRALAGKRVLIVHPFIDSIIKQYQKRELLFENKSILPEFSELICVRAVQSNAGETSIYNDWFDALEHMEKEISKYDFDIAIIGAGAYSLPLAAYVKQLGKIAVQMSGSTQILFGIKGKRWEQIPEISKFFNDNWIRPSEDETPKGSTKVEGGSYW